MNKYKTGIKLKAEESFLGSFETLDKTKPNLSFIFVNYTFSRGAKLYLDQS